ncbi:alpha/beta fold hydrolase [Bdellovibrio sp. HCB117]|uniref:alpha/beta fold hydrolase n=1 Tax=Bdellovibrio sp. HCB117 TaxID=3394359 RepID=UPI0039B6BD46
MKTGLLAFAILFVSAVSFAEVHYLPLGPGKVLAYEYVEVSPSAPTLILLPGVNRGLSSNDTSVRLLIQQGWNLLLPSLPAHPKSIQGLKLSESPYFTYDSSVRSPDFANDVSELVHALGILRAVPVTLSYTSSVGAYLDAKEFPHIIETVPMAVPTESDPDAAKTAELWESWFKLNPFMAPFWIRQFRDQAYTSHWHKTVDKNLSADSDFYGENPRVSDIKKGYVTIARAAEDFDFTKWDFHSEQRTRDFVFAENENPERLKNQVEVLKRYLATGKPVRVILVQNVGHVLPTENPEVYAATLGLLLRQSRRAQTQFAVVSTAKSVESIEWKDRSALDAWIKENQR